MNNFYISKLIITGTDKTTSSIDFIDGLNIIYGLSDTGKSCIIKCIDFIFGSKEQPFDITTGYSNVILKIITINGEITFERKLGKNIIIANSQNPYINSGKYKIKGNPNINTIWLNLIGIENEPEIIKNENFETQRLTWRTLLNMFLIKEDDIFESSSILMPKFPTAATAFLSSLLFLISAPDFSLYTPQEAKNVKEARKIAVENYINTEIYKLTKRKQDLEKSLSLINHNDLEFTINSLINELQTIENKIAKEVNNSKKTLSQILTERDKLDQCNLLLNRYQVLKNQYETDIKRLSFLVDSENILESVDILGKCPFCDGPISKQKKESYIASSNAELKKIVTQLNDLGNIQNEVSQEKNTIEKTIQKMVLERNNIKFFISKELQPKAKELKMKVSTYKEYIKIKNESELIEKFAQEHTSELIKIKSKENNKPLKFKPKEYYPSDFNKNFSEYLFEALKTCKYENFTSAYFDINKFDAVINGKLKSTHGKGFKAFINTILAFTMQKYLKENGKFTPGIFIADSPLLSLKQDISDETPNNMKTALFEYLINNQNIGQTIIIENEIPKLDYASYGVKLHYFTKGKTKGRYGFLLDLK